MKDGKLGVCILGCGFMGSKHAECWDRNPQAQVVAVVDLLPDRARRLANLYGLKNIHSDYREALVLPEIDVVSVCTPTCHHAEMSTFAFRMGKHVLSEKPMALYLKEAEQMLAASRRQGVLLGIGLMRRHSPVSSALRQYLAEGHLGRPVMYAASDVHEQRPQVEMHDAYANGGPVIDMAVHLFDLWANLFHSQAVSVYAQGLTLASSERPGLENIAMLATDSANILVTFASGDIGSFTVCWGLPPGVNPAPHPDHIYGPKGMLEVEYLMARQQARRLLPGDEWEIVTQSDEDMYQREIDDFVASIMAGKLPQASGEHGLAALRVARAALDSIRTGAPVKL